MSPELRARFDKLDQRMNQMIARVKAMPENVSTAPVGKSFSPIQAIDHMAVVEGLYAGFIASGVAKGFPKGKSKPNFMLGFVKKRMQIPNKNAPTVKEVKPVGTGSLEVHSIRWVETRKLVRAHYEKYSDDDACLKHSFFGTMSPADICGLLEIHQDYHEARLP